MIVNKYISGAFTAVLFFGDLAWKTTLGTFWRRLPPEHLELGDPPKWCCTIVIEKPGRTQRYPNDTPKEHVSVSNFRRCPKPQESISSPKSKMPGIRDPHTAFSYLPFLVLSFSFLLPFLFFPLLVLSSSFPFPFFFLSFSSLLPFLFLSSFFPFPVLFFSLFFPLSFFFLSSFLPLPFFVLSSSFALPLPLTDSSRSRRGNRKTKNEGERSQSAPQNRSKFVTEVANQIALEHFCIMNHPKAKIASETNRTRKDLFQLEGQKPLWIGKR